MNNEQKDEEILTTSELDQEKPLENRNENIQNGISCM
jgi:hypothetical protein